jgi:hypothetical protein
MDLSEAKTPASKNNCLVVIVTVLITFVLTAPGVGVGVYYWQKIACENKEAETSSDKSASTSTPTSDLPYSDSATETPVTLYSNEATTRTMTFEGDAPVDITEQFMLATLGTLPGASINYTKAKQLSSANLLSQWTDDSFVPAFYGIQDGPDTFDIRTQTTTGDESYVTVEVLYGSSLYNWAFNLVYEGGGWKVDSFRNDGQ